VDWVDIIHYPELVEHLRVHDQTLRDLSDYCRASPDPDGEGILDSIEESVGHGFFHLQRYMIRRKRTTPNPYTCGPRVGEYHFAQVINTAANYWKHLDEWPAKIKPDSREAQTLRILCHTGATSRDYRLSHLLRVLEPQEGTLTGLLPRVVGWREALDLQLAKAQPAS
jgi:hypothetical protein